MAMTWCVATGCRNYDSPTIDTGVPKPTFFTFPLSNPELLKQWMENLDMRECEATELTKLCSDHFEESCMVRVGNSFVLKVNSVPTKFPIVLGSLLLVQSGSSSLIVEPAAAVSQVQQPFRMPALSLLKKKKKKRHNKATVVSSQHNPEEPSTSSAGQNIASTFSAGQNIASTSSAGQNIASTSSAGQNITSTSSAGQNIANTSSAGQNIPKYCLVCHSSAVSSICRSEYWLVCRSEYCLICHSSAASHICHSEYCLVCHSSAASLICRSEYCLVCHSSAVSSICRSEYWLIRRSEYCLICHSSTASHICCSEYCLVCHSSTASHICRSEYCLVCRSEYCLICHSSAVVDGSKVLAALQNPQAPLDCARTQTYKRKPMFPYQSSSPRKVTESIASSSSSISVGSESLPPIVRSKSTSNIAETPSTSQVRCKSTTNLTSAVEEENGFLMRRLLLRPKSANFDDDDKSSSGYSIIEDSDSGSEDIASSQDEDNLDDVGSDFLSTASESEGDDAKSETAVEKPKQKEVPRSKSAMEVSNAELGAKGSKCNAEAHELPLEYLSALTARSAERLKERMKAIKSTKKSPAKTSSPKRKGTPPVKPRLSRSKSNPNLATKLSPPRPKKSNLEKSKSNSNLAETSDRKIVGARETLTSNKRRRSKSVGEPLSSSPTHLTRRQAKEMGVNVPRIPEEEPRCDAVKRNRLSKLCTQYSDIKILKVESWEGKKLFEELPSPSKSQEPVQEPTAVPIRMNNFFNESVVFQPMINANVPMVNIIVNNTAEPNFDVIRFMNAIELQHAFVGNPTKNNESGPSLNNITPFVPVYDKSVASTALGSVPGPKQTSSTSVVISPPEPRENNKALPTRFVESIPGPSGNTNTAPTSVSKPSTNNLTSFIRIAPRPSNSIDKPTSVVENIVSKSLLKILPVINSNVSKSAKTPLNTKSVPEVNKNAATQRNNEQVPATNTAAMTSAKKSDIFTRFADPLAAHALLKLQQKVQMFKQIDLMNAEPEDTPVKRGRPNILKPHAPMKKVPPRSKTPSRPTTPEATPTTTPTTPKTPTQPKTPEPQIIHLDADEEHGPVYVKIIKNKVKSESKKESIATTSNLETTPEKSRPKTPTSSNIKVATFKTPSSAMVKVIAMPATTALLKTVAQISTEPKRRAVAKKSTSRGQMVLKDKQKAAEKSPVPVPPVKMLASFKVARKRTRPMPAVEKEKIAQVSRSTLRKQLPQGSPAKPLFLLESPVKEQETNGKISSAELALNKLLERNRNKEAVPTVQEVAPIVQEPTPTVQEPTVTAPEPSSPGIVKRLRPRAKSVDPVRANEALDHTMTTRSRSRSRARPRARSQSRPRSARSRSRSGRSKSRARSRSRKSGGKNPTKTRRNSNFIDNEESEIDLSRPVTPLSRPVTPLSRPVTPLLRAITPSSSLETSDDSQDMAKKRPRTPKPTTPFGDSESERAATPLPSTSFDTDNAAKRPKRAATPLPFNLLPESDDTASLDSIEVPPKRSRRLSRPLSKESENEGVPKRQSRSRTPRPTTPFKDLAESENEGVPKRQRRARTPRPTTPFNDLVESENEGVPKRQRRARTPRPTTPFIDLAESENEGVPKRQRRARTPRPTTPFKDLAESENEGVPKRESRSRTPSRPTTPFNDVAESENEGVPKRQSRSRTPRPTTPFNNFVESENEGVPKPRRRARTPRPTTPFIDLAESENEGVPQQQSRTRTPRPTTPFIDLAESENEGVPKRQSRSRTPRPTTPFIDLAESENEGVPKQQRRSRTPRPRTPFNDLAESANEGVPKRQSRSRNSKTPFMDSDTSNPTAPTEVAPKQSADTADTKQTTGGNKRSKRLTKPNKLSEDMVNLAAKRQKRAENPTPTLSETESAESSKVRHKRSRHLSTPSSSKDLVDEDAPCKVTLKPILIANSEDDLPVPKRAKRSATPTPFKDSTKHPPIDEDKQTTSEDSASGSDARQRPTVSRRMSTEKCNLNNKSLPLAEKTRRVRGTASHRSRTLAAVDTTNHSQVNAVPIVKVAFKNFENKAETTEPGNSVASKPVVGDSTDESAEHTQQAMWSSSNAQSADESAEHTQQAMGSSSNAQSADEMATSAQPAVEVHSSVQTVAESSKHPQPTAASSKSTNLTAESSKNTETTTVSSKNIDVEAGSSKNIDVTAESSNTTGPVAADNSKHSQSVSHKTCPISGISKYTYAKPVSSSTAESSKPVAEYSKLTPSVSESSTGISKYTYCKPESSRTGAASPGVTENSQKSNENTSEEKPRPLFKPPVYCKQAHIIYRLKSTKNIQTSKNPVKSSKVNSKNSEASKSQNDAQKISENKSKSVPSPLEATEVDKQKSLPSTDSPGSIISDTGEKNSSQNTDLAPSISSETGKEMSPQGANLVPSAHKIYFTVEKTSSQNTNLVPETSVTSGTTQTESLQSTNPLPSTSTSSETHEGSPQSTNLLQLTPKSTETAEKESLQSTNPLPSTPTSCETGKPEGSNPLPPASSVNVDALPAGDVDQYSLVDDRKARDMIALSLMMRARGNNRNFTLTKGPNYFSFHCQSEHKVWSNLCFVSKYSSHAKDTLNLSSMIEICYNVFSKHIETERTFVILISDMKLNKLDRVYDVPINKLNTKYINLKMPEIKTNPVLKITDTSLEQKMSKFHKNPNRFLENFLIASRQRTIVELEKFVERFKLPAVVLQNLKDLDVSRSTLRKQLPQGSPAKPLFLLESPVKEQETNGKISSAELALNKLLERNRNKEAVPTVQEVAPIVQEPTPTVQEPTVTAPEPSSPGIVKRLRPRAKRVGPDLGLGQGLGRNLGLGQLGPVLGQVGRKVEHGLEVESQEARIQRRQGGTRISLTMRSQKSICRDLLLPYQDLLLPCQDL
ncbi:hypothetical protein B566_EDAN017252 [Ephemera danica]|nr:hypothetical protein B566_EDAN017252 [Ephemera danica]